MVYSSINTGMALFVLPIEAERLNQTGRSVWVGVYLAVCGLTQIICPIAGKVSDRHASRDGRRWPFIKWGSVVALGSCAALWASSLFRWRYMYVLSLFCSQLALNLIFSAQCALPVDMQQ